MDGLFDTDQLRAHFGTVSHLAAIKAQQRLDHHCRAFIALSPFLVLATSDGAGQMDASPRGDAPGFVRVIDDGTLLLPDRPGNNRVDSFANIIANPGVALLFMVPGISETLRVNGRARLITDQVLLEPSQAQGKIPRTGLLVSVEEAFLHCGKALIRSSLWDGSRHVPRGTFPSIGRVIAEQTGAADPDQAERSTQEGYRDRLY
jgi:PPOX class probable FMN-dependent enzyme